MHLEIVSPESTLFSGEVISVRLPGTVGQFEVLKDHAPLISTLDAGDIRIRHADGREEHFQVNSGCVEVLKNNITVMV